MGTQRYFLCILSFWENEFLDASGAEVMGRIEADLLALRCILGRLIIWRRDSLLAKEVSVNHVV